MMREEFGLSFDVGRPCSCDGITIQGINEDGKGVWVLKKDFRNKVVAVAYSVCLESLESFLPRKSVKHRKWCALKFSFGSFGCEIVCLKTMIISWMHTNDSLRLCYLFTWFVWTLTFCYWNLRWALRLALRWMLTFWHLNQEDSDNSNDSLKKLVLTSLLVMESVLQSVSFEAKIKSCFGRRTQTELREEDEDTDESSQAYNMWCLLSLFSFGFFFMTRL